MLVIDASVVVAAMTDGGEAGHWAERELASGPLCAPSLMPFEAANVFRRLALAGTISDDVATMAHRDLVDLPIELVAYETIAPRGWGLRGNLTIYDASYVALASMLDAPLATLDVRLANAPTLTCEVRVP